MAIWQYHSFLLPRAPFETRFGDQKENLPRERVIDVPDMWPDEKVALAALQDLALILPEMVDYWAAPSGRAWGSYDSDIIEANFEAGRLEEVEIRVDLRTPRLDFVQPILQVAQRHDLLLFTEDNSALLPDLSSFIRALTKSRGVRFLNDPNDYLNRAQEDL